MNTWSKRRIKMFFRTWIILVGVLTSIAVVTVIWDDHSITQLVTDFMILCVMVVALQTFIGNSGIISFGHVAFFGIGAYVAALLTISPRIKAISLPELPEFILQLNVGLTSTVLIAAAIAFIFSLIIGLALTRMSEGALAMATLALLVMLHSIFANWESVTRGTSGLYGIPRNITISNSWLFAVIVSAIALLFKASAFGLNLQATRDDPLAASALSVNITRTRLYGWIISTTLMSVGGALWAQNNLAFGPNQFYYAETFTLLSMLVIGGFTSVSGAIVGVAVVMTVGELLRGLENGLSIGTWFTLPELPGVAQMTIALMIIIILILRPHGLLGLNEFVNLVSKWQTKKRKT
jgi:branched-chain amino acid transport system permease protein